MVKLTSQITILTPLSDSSYFYFNKVWKQRDLIITLAKRELKIKYAQTYLGFFWVILQPFPSVILFTFVFDTLIKLDTGRLPYPVFALIGMIGWGHFTNLTSGIGGSLIESQNILKKIYFPKIIIPLSKILVSGTDFLISFGAVVIVMIFLGQAPTRTIIFFPLFLSYNILAGFAVGIWLAALTFRHRDFQLVSPSIINFLVWLTPVFYPSTILPANFKWFLYLNPVAFTIEGYRYTLVGSDPPSIYYFASALPILIFLITGSWYFRRIEDKITEYI